MLLQPLSHPRIPEAVLAPTAEDHQSVSSASSGHITAHTQRPADIYQGVQLDTCEEGAAAHLLGARARVSRHRRSCGSPVPHP